MPDREYGPGDSSDPMISLVAGDVTPLDRLRRQMVRNDISTLTDCPDCSAHPGQPHEDGCDVECCSACGGQRLQCDCAEHDRLFSRWSGIWPGKAEAMALGIDLNELDRNYRRIFFVKPPGGFREALATTGEDTISAQEPAFESRFMTDEEARDTFERAARRSLGMSGEEFLSRWDAGEWPDPDSVPGVMAVAMLIPLVRPSSSQ